MTPVTSPFKFLDSYNQEDGDIFFGRGKETNDLYQALSGVKHLLVYGPSGAGKTSLVECGLRNQFSDADWYALTIRRGADMTASVFSEINKVLREPIPLDPNTKRPLNPGTDFGQVIEDLFSERYQPVYLLFDQFEELLISGSEEEKKDFFKRLNQLIRYKVPCRVMLIMREEFIGHLSEFEPLCPSIFQHRFRVEKMRKENVKEVIRETLDAPHYRTYFLVDNSEELAESILSKLPDKSREIELAHVQVFLSELWDRANAPVPKVEGRVVLHAGLIREQDNLVGVLDSFLKNQLDELDKIYGDKVPLETLAAMISERHTKLQVSADDLQKDLADKGVHLKRPLEELLLDLERRRILRTLKSGEQTQYEISHDVLALVVGKNLTNEMELRAKAADIYRVYEERKGFFSQEDLDLIRPYQQYKAYSSALEQRIKESEDHLHAEAQRVQRENAEKLAAEEARIAREKAEADRRRKRALLTSLVAGILVLAAVIAIIFALMKSAEAEQQAQRAQDAIALAEEKKREAAESDSVALKEKGNAQRALKYAKEAQQLADEKEKIARKAEARAQAAILQSGIDSEMARIAKQEAEDKRLEADEATRKANAAKLEAEKLALQVVSNLLPQIRRDILYLDYGAAYSKIKEASSLNALQDSLAFECMEVAWFYHHSGKDKLAREPFDLAAELLDKDMVKSRRDFSALNPERAQFLEARYFGEMVAIKGGKFYMQGDFYGGEVPVYLGVIEDFSMSKYETTVWQYNLFCAEKGWNITQRISWYSQTSLEVEKYQPSWGWLGNNPVVYVSWYDAAVYANWLSLKLGKKPAYDISMERDSLNESSSDVFGWTVTPVQNDNCYRLPTEMEWEFAAKHGLTGGPSPYSGSNILDSLAWYVENSKNRTQAVGLKKSNAAGIFDMSGNVWEWCYDWYGDLPAENALGSRKGSKRVMRGGSWGDEQGVCRVAYRSGIDPDGRHPRIGFRLVFVP